MKNKNKRIMSKKKASFVVLALCLLLFSVFLLNGVGKTVLADEQKQKVASASEQNQKATSASEQNQKSISASEQNQKTTSANEQNQKSVSTSEQTQKSISANEQNQKSVSASEQEQNQTAASADEQNQKNPKGSTAKLEYSTIKELDGHKVGVLTGSNQPPIVARILPNAELCYYNAIMDEMQALKTHKVDAYVDDEVFIKQMTKDDDSVAWLPDELATNTYACAFPMDEDGKKLQAEVSEFVVSLKENGTLREIEEIWMGEDDSKKQPTGYELLPAVNGTVRLAAEAQIYPLVYMKNNQIVGYEIDILTRFCKERGYALQIEDMSFSAVLAAVQSSKYDVGVAAITVTPEREKMMLFAAPHYETGMVLAVRTNATEGTGFFDRLKKSFTDTFITDDRYLLFLQGIGNTLLITFISLISGTILGFLIYLLCRMRGRIVNAVTKAAIWLVNGMPILVLLMVLYYLIFANSDISGIAVSIIGFTITFGATVFGMLNSGVEKVDRGQEEGAFALGTSPRQTFFEIILPQAIPLILPEYKGAAGSLIRATSIVGYIAVQDLTKMGDVVRGITYEAFFPLVAVAIIYFVLAILMNLLIGLLIGRVNPRKRSREAILKGVKTHD